MLDMWTEDGRADTAPRLDSIEAAESDEWTLHTVVTPFEQRDTSIASSPIEQVGVTRIHRKARSTLFTPMKVPGAPRAGEITPTRITTGEFIDSGEKFCYIDCWTRRDKLAHMDIKRRWKGSTTFIKRSSEWPAERVAGKA